MAKSELLQIERGVQMLKAVALAASALAGPAYAAFPQDFVLPAGARAMTAIEIHNLYRDKSWQWESGAGLMKDEGRQFSAWVEGEKGKSWAEGRWVITDTGLMCFEATWHTEGGAIPAKTCFSHRIDSGTIYQKREPDGKWYVFRHAEPRKDDEASKLVATDLVSQQRENIQAALSATRLPEHDKRAAITSESVTSGAYDPHGDYTNDPNAKIEHLFLPWEDVDLTTLNAADDYAHERGRSLMITIEPWSWTRDWRVSPDDLLSGILTARYDSKMAAVCSAAAKLKSPVIIRWAQEMDAKDGQFTWSRWKPEGYVKAYRHVIDICRKHLPSARYMWSPKGEEGLEAYYPGDNYVDIVGLSIFAYQPYDKLEFGRDTTFVERTKPAYDRVAGFGKPVAVAELGYEGSDDYVRDWAAEANKPHTEFPAMIAVVYFNDREVYPWPRNVGRPDWRVANHPLDGQVSRERTGYSPHR